MSDNSCRRGLYLVLSLVLWGPEMGTLRAQGDASGKSAGGAPRKPNVIFILADDLGYGDLGCYGQRQIQTPHLDRLAAEGVRFTQHYAGSTICAPSRCCLLTGRHTGHVNIRGNTPALLSPNEITVARLFKRAGYATAAIGKWGVGQPPPPGDPARHGFDDFYGYLEMRHAHNHFPDFLWHNGQKLAIRGNVVMVVGGGGVAIKRSQYSQDLFTDQAVSWITEHKAEPFFLYLPFIIPHANNEAGQAGMEVPDAGIYRDREWPEPQRNHAAMITRLDESVGRIVALLKQLNLDEQTLILFSSDNGPHKEGGADPAFFNSSGGLRGYKRDLYEGGIRVPHIARWPGKIEPNRVSALPSASWDFLPTMAELIGVQSLKDTDGLSYLPTLLNEPDKQRTHPFLYWEFHERVRQGKAQQAVRMGDWKLVRMATGRIELYDLKTDPGEKRNVAANHPAVVDSILFYLRTARTPSPNFPLGFAPVPQDD